MKRLLLLFLALFSGTGAAEFSSTPDSLVRQFIIEYRKWNDEAFRLQSSQREAGMRQAELAYSKLLSKFCLPGFKGQAIAFGTDSMHSPELEKIVATSVKSSSAVVKTQAKSSVVKNFVSDYEYHLIRKSGRWYLEEIYYVDSDGKYQSL